MHSSVAAEHLLCLLTQPDRAASIIGDFQEQARGRGSLWFWSQVIRAALALFGRSLASQNEDIWLLEFARSVTTRLTFDPKRDVGPVWSPDGRQIAFSSNRSGVFQIYRKDAGGGL